MAVYNFHIFDSKGNCLFSLKEEKGEEFDRVLYGFLYSLKSFANRITPAVVKDNNFLTYSTNCYQLVFMELQTSIKFVLICSKELNRTNEQYKQLMRDIYRNVYVEYHVKNPVKTPDCTSINSLLFREKLVELLNKI